MKNEETLAEALRTHPCYNEAAHLKYARMHIPVAPKCNIQCNFCNRKYDCTNESRPGVTSEVLTPEQAVEKIRYVKKRVPNLKVIGIAGPGDPMANNETFQTLELVGKEFPEMTLCISTNGLALPQNVERLWDLGVRFVTVTINAPDPQIGAKMYSAVLWQGKRLTGEEGAAVLLERQLQGIKMCADRGMLVKANIVMVPDVNATSIPVLVKKVKAQGAYIVNILPLIPVPGTKFEHERAPTPAERKALMDRCSVDARMMRHCKQCRADAIGLLDHDRSGEFAGCMMGRGCGPAEQDPPVLIRPDLGSKYTVAVASDGGQRVDAGFGNASRFLVYAVDGADVKLLRQVRPENADIPLSGEFHKEHVEQIVTLLDDCDCIIVREIGSMPRSVIEHRGKRVILSEDMIRVAVSALGSS
ncbi:MAG: nitrogenase cofactor biosynthesis protein NifB [Candidatus Methanomethylophilus sp.]|nr:nitrogenase cofactor biosynthesis protein NifB [Methanomethylophilus sp.]MDD3232562.1 nitrogenase cofactor biosynthesis protein NifB [Methanomethylophilus sp.]MDD4221657.1 nitrogenase cofactor biosynthesis protein NifB [Methanomethylophilus sp.]MDD4668297.1 nitrogenase cofactor biosynthesis protein NifB [Methanomethylophilus sp.]